MRKLLWLMMALGIITSGVFAVANIQFRVNKVGNIRSGPGTNYPIIEKIVPPQQWKVYGLHGDWVKIGESKYVYQNLGNYTMKKLVLSKPRATKLSVINPPPTIKFKERNKPEPEDTAPTIITPTVKSKPIVVTKIIIEREPSLLNNTMQIVLLVAVGVISVLFVIFEMIGRRNRPTKIIYRDSQPKKSIADNSFQLLKER